jgi:hypothetical protein
MRARRSILAGLIATFTLVTASPALAQTMTPGPLGGQGGSGICHVGPSLICAADDIVDAAGDLIGGAAKRGAGAAADAVMGGVVDWAAGGAAWLLRTIGRQVERSSRPAIGSGWFSKRYAAMRRMAVALSLAFLLIAICHAALRHDLQLLVRCTLVALPASLLLMFAAVTLVELALALTDELSIAALGGADANVRDAFSDLGNVLAPASGAAPALPGFLIFIAAVLTALLAMLVWLELVLREAAIYLAVAFLPLALATAVWPRTVNWSQRLASWLCALILAKLTIATAFSLAGDMLANARPGSGGLSALLAGCAVLVLAAASPWVLLRLIPFTAGGAGGLHRRDIGGAVRQAPGVGAGLLLAKHGLGRGAGAVAGGASASGQAGRRNWSPPAARSSEAKRAPNER